MISNIFDCSSEQFINLGLQVNNKFDKLFSLDNILNDSNNILFGYYEKDELIGFIHLVKLVDELEIINIVVDYNHRNKGIGSKLLEYVFSNVDNIKKIFLEVNVNNINAIKLYKKYGFKVINVRNNYYGNDDCYVMGKEFIV